MDAQSIADLGQRTMSDRDAVPADTAFEPEHWLGVIGLPQPGSVIVEE